MPTGFGLRFPKRNRFQRFSLKMLIGSNEYLDEHGEMPEPVASSGIPVVEVPKGEEEEDPPGEWTTPEVLVGDEPDMRMHSKRTLYAWLRCGTLWARFYVGVHGMGLLEENDAVSCPVMEVHEKYVVVDGSIIHDSSTGSSSSSETGNDTREEEDPAEEDPAEEEKWDLSTLNIGDFVTVKVTHLLDQSYDVWAEIVDDFRAVVITAPRQDLPKLRVGDISQEVKITDLRGQYFTCECPPNLEVKCGDPGAFGNTQEDASNQPQQRLALGV